MTDRRMSSLKIIDSDLFSDMSLSSQCLYFHLSMRADDDGLINNPEKIIKIIGVDEDGLKTLTAKGFVIVSNQGIIIVIHQKISNFIRKDRHKPTLYENELYSLSQTESGMYIKEVGRHLVDQRLPSDQPNIDKGRLDKVSIDKGRGGKENRAAPTFFHRKYQSVRSTEEEYHRPRDKLQSHIDIMVRRPLRHIKDFGRHYEDHYVTILNWYEEDGDKLRQKVLNKKINYDVGESLQIKGDGKPLLETLSLKRYKVCQGQ